MIEWRQFPLAARRIPKIDRWQLVPHDRPARVPHTTGCAIGEKVTQKYYDFLLRAPRTPLLRDEADLHVICSAAEKDAELYDTDCTFVNVGFSFLHFCYRQQGWHWAWGVRLGHTKLRQFVWPNLTARPNVTPVDGIEYKMGKVFSNIN